MALLLRRALRGCLILAAVGLLLFAVVGDRRMEDFISRMRDRHEVGDENSGLSKLLRKTTTDIRPCCDATKTMSLKMFVDQSYQCEQRISVKENLYCGCQEVFACKMVVLTAFSDNHLEEAKDFIGSVQTHMPLTQILVYNLKLSRDKIDYLEQLCNVKVMEFPYEKFPPFVRNLRTFSWKPLIVNEVASSGDYEIVMWCDASCRLHQPLYPILPRLMAHHLIPGPTSHLTFISTVHDGMLSYLNIKQNRSDLAKLGRSLQANAIILWINNEIRTKFLKFWVDCALHEECISPEGARVGPCSFYHMLEGMYIDCHRYDQAAYNAILTREYGLDFMMEIKDGDSDIRNYLTIFRGVSYLYHLVNNCPL